MAAVAEDEWQLSSHPKAVTVTFADPPPNLPLSPVTPALQEVDGAAQLTCTENVPVT